MIPLLATVAGAVGLLISPLVLAAIDRAPGDDPLLGDLAGRTRTRWSRRRPTDVVTGGVHAALWGAAAGRFGLHLPLLVYLPFFSTVLLLAVVDLRTYLLPNRITYPAIAGTAAGIGTVSLLADDVPEGGMVGAVIAAVAWAGFLLVLLFLFQLVTGKEGLGLGDVKLAVLLGLGVGWVHPVLVIPALFIAGVAGMVAGLVTLALRAGENRPYPFGPWLGVGAVTAILASAPLLDALGL